MTLGKPLFLTHIGTGKTGSTSIQRFLKDKRQQHKKLGLHYLGLHLSYTEQELLYPWQSEDEAHVFEFQLLDDSTAYQQLNDVLCQLLQSASLPPCFIWSFESIYDRPQVYGNIFHSLRETFDINFKFLAFTRSHDDFLRSAYNQWGLKHKTYEGPILSFNDWASRNKGFLAYGNKLKRWDDLFKEDLILFNYHESADSVASLINILPIAIREAVQKTYDFDRYEITPRDHLLTLYALFHNRNFERALPLEVMDLLSRYPQLRQNHTSLPRAFELFPDSQAIHQVITEQMLGFDAALINSMLKHRGQKIFDDYKMQLENCADIVDKNELDYKVLSTLVSMLLTLLLEQDKRIASLESKDHKNFS